MILVFHSVMSLPTSYVDPFFPTPPDLATARSICPSGDAYFFYSLPRTFPKIFWPLSFLACWATCLMETPASSQSPSCSCNSVTPTFKSSLSSRYILFAFACLEQRPTGSPRSWMLRQRRFQSPLGARWSFCHCPLILDAMPLVLPVFLLGCLLFLALLPAPCARHEVVLFLPCQRAGKFYCLLSSSS